MIVYTIDDVAPLPLENQVSCCSVIREEFQPHSFGFDFSRRDAFQTSQWRWPNFVFVGYRVMVAAYAVAVVIYTAAYTSSDFIHPYMSWLTYWSFLVLTLYLTYAAVLAIVSAFCEKSCSWRTWCGCGGLPVYLKLEWLLFSPATILAPIVTISYYTYTYSIDTDKNFSRDMSHNEHIGNSVLVLLELCVSAVPVRLFHFVYASAFAAFYAVFSVIYWQDDRSRVLYYGFCDWNNPGLATASVIILCLAVVPIIQIIYFCLYMLRLRAYRFIFDEPYIG